MVSIAQAIQQTEEAEETAKVRERQIKEARQRARRIRVGGGVKEQLRFGRGFKAARQQAKKQRERALQQIESAEEELSLFRKGITRRRSEIAEASKPTESQRIARIAESVRRGKPALAGETTATKRKVEQLLAKQRERTKVLSESLVLGRATAFSAALKRGELEGFAPISLPSGEVGFVSTTEDTSTIFQPIQTLDPGQTKGGGVLLGSVSETTFQQQPKLSIFDILPPKQIKERDKGFIERIREETFNVQTSTSLPEFLLGDRFTKISQKVRKQPALTPAFIGLGTTAVIGQEAKRVFKSPKFSGLISEVATTTGPNIFSPFFSRKQQKEAIRTASGFGGRFLGELTPTTGREVSQLSLSIASLSALGRFSPTLEKIALGGLGGIEIGTAVFDPDLTIEQRAFKSIAGGGAVTLGVFSPTKFELGLKGQRAQVSALLERGIISEETAVSLRSGIELQKFFRRTKDPEITKSIQDIIPKEISTSQRVVVEEFLLGKKPLVFGGKSLELRNIRSGSDIDVALKNNVKELKILAKNLRKVGPVSIRGEALGVGGGDKLFDVKAIARLEDFPLSQKPIKTTEGIPTPRASEQFSRSLSGTIGFGGEVFRKGGKDFPDVLNIGKTILSQAKSTLEGTRFPGLSLIRQRRLAKAEKQFLQLEKASPEIEKLTGLDVTIEGFRPTTITPGFSDVAKEIEKIFPPGKRAQVGRLDISKPPKTIKRIKVNPGRLGKISDISSEFGKFGVGSQFKSSKINLRVSTFSLKGFEQSLFKPPTTQRKKTPVPSIFEPPRQERVTPGIRISPVGSKFTPPVTTTSTFDFPPPPPLRPFQEISFDPTSARTLRKRKSDDKRKTKKKPSSKIKPLSPISISFTAIGANIFGKFPKVRTKGLGLTPEQIRFQPLIKPPKRISLAGINPKRKKT